MKLNLFDPATATVEHPPGPVHQFLCRARHRRAYTLTGTHADTCTCPACSHRVLRCNPV